ncbi:MAG: glycoside hydrolase family 5 protein [Bacteroides sp.]|nr:glycoside hydrolase family 5 protein [Prevotella sp.]MCM1407529.1 glycoside hydrolase family 5 protein [Treponema brennaborense]MCM1470019.1 glycoside hydrolase family 5 protein [Bacteroides sp.]
MKRMLPLLIKSALFFLLTGGGIFFSCGQIFGDKDASSEQSFGEQKTIWQGAETFGDWSKNVYVAAEIFDDAADGSEIILFVSKISGAEYHAVKIYENASGTWQFLSSGNISGAYLSGSGNDASFTPTSDTITYTLTSSDAEKLKTDGLYVNGFGVVISKIELKTSGGSGNDGSQTEMPAAPNPPPVSESGTPFANHGKLHVSGAYLYDEHDQKYQLYGMSTHGLNFGEEMTRYVNKAALETLRDDWNTNCIRLVLYPKDYNGYCNGGDKTALKQIICGGIDAATELGMYVIVDWHVHNYNPNDTKDDAKTFLAEISQKYAEYGNVLYEICNEPTNSPWSTVIKPYAKELIPVIRANAPDAVIIVGTDNWSQKLDEAWNDKLDFENVMYTFHFYANTHTGDMRTRVENAVKNGMPVFITEFGTCDASGDGGFNSTQSQKWFDLLEKYSISHLNWSLCNKGETASAIGSGCAKTSGWTESDLTESGKLVRSHFRTLSR